MLKKIIAGVPLEEPSIRLVLGEKRNRLLDLIERAVDEVDVPAVLERRRESASTARCIHRARTVSARQALRIRGRHPAGEHITTRRPGFRNSRRKSRRYLSRMSFREATCPSALKCAK
jgi:hypothetical protein